MTQNEWLIVASTLLGPVLAVQAQKWVERASATTLRREQVFTTLMATRQARLSPEHVRALNSIDLAFYGRRVFGHVWRGAKAQAVVNAWRDYHAHLSLPPERRPQNEAQGQGWNATADELFINLLDCLARSTNHQFERSQLKLGSYSPEAHGAVELEQQAIRKGLLDVLQGRTPLPLNIETWPVDPEGAERLKTIQINIVDILNRLSQR
jgi:hypothetical protein